MGRDRSKPPGFLYDPFLKSGDNSKMNEKSKPERRIAVMSIPEKMIPPLFY